LFFVANGGEVCLFSREKLLTVEYTIKSK